jgi:DNA-binding NarL/FixJ family response regulator
MKRPRILMADDHRLLMEGMKRLLEQDFELVGAVEDGRALMEAAARLVPDVILIDISMPKLNGIEAARQLKNLLPQCKMLIVTMHADATYVREALRAGVSGYVLKRAAASELVKAIREVLNGRIYVTPSIAQTIELPQGPGFRPKRASPELTGRQREILQLVAEGRSNKEIGGILHVSIKTVEFHKACIMRKLGIHTTAELTKYAVKHGVVEV